MTQLGDKVVEATLLQVAADVLGEAAAGRDDRLLAGEPEREAHDRID